MSLPDNSIVKPIYFIGYDAHYGSSLLRAKQISMGLDQVYGVKSRLIFFEGDCINKDNYQDKVGHIKDAIIIMVKGNFFYLDSITPFLDFMKSNNNTMILDLIDYIYFTKWQKLFMTIYRYDAIIVQNNFIHDEIVNRYSYAGICKVIQHHWDPNLKRQIYDSSNTPLKICFTGLVRDHVDSPELNCNYLEELDIYMGHHYDQYHPCHFSIRKKNTWQALTKSNIKLSNASACGSNIIITLDESIKGLIDLDYPYLLKGDSLEETKQMVNYVKETYGGPIWQKGLDMMNIIREKTSLLKVLPNYIELLMEVK
jgi:hypothetical protein